MLRYRTNIILVLIIMILCMILFDHPEWVLIQQENAQKILVLLITSLPLSLSIDELRSISDIKWNRIVGLGLLYIALIYLSFDNFRLPVFEFNYYNLLYVGTFYLFSFFILYITYFLVFPADKAWRQLFYVSVTVLSSLFYTAVSLLGIYGVYYLITHLFFEGLSPKNYSYLWIALGILIFHFYFFYIKTDYENTAPKGYPKGLITFSSYVLFPIYILLSGLLAITFYLVIFQKYGTDSWVNYLLLSYLFLGFVIYFLVSPIRNDDAERPWIKSYQRWFFYMLIPLGFLILYDTLLRTQKLGFTEPRYLLFFIGLLSLYWGVSFLLQHSRPNMIQMGISSVIVLFILLFGPLNMNSYCNRSQTKKLMNILERDSLIKNGRLLEDFDSYKKVHEDDKLQIQSQLEYLYHKQYNAYRSILAPVDSNFNPFSYFNYRKDPYLAALVEVAPKSFFIELDVMPEQSMTYATPIDSFHFFSILQNKSEFTNIELENDSNNILIINNLNKVGYSIDITEAVQANHHYLIGKYGSLKDSNIYQFPDEDFTDFYVSLVSADDTIPAKISIQNLGYSFQDQKFIVTDLKAYVFY